MKHLLVIYLLFLGLNAQAQAELSATDIIHKVIEHSGGDVWHHPESLTLEGYSVFFPKGTQDSKVVAESHKMWRQFAPTSEAAHLANGKVRIDIFSKGQRMFQMSFDGENAYNHEGVMPGGAANPQWRNAFGFGVIRYALNPGFTLHRLPDDTVDGLPCYMIRVVDPSQGETMFGIDEESFAPRMVAFQTDRGWHHRTYSEFVVDEKTGWRQPRLVKLFYNGVKANEVHWTSFTVNSSLSEKLFVLPDDVAEQ
ncbi:MAG: hypothetical protein AAF438_05610 [Pseudomonadota bacterium]